MVRRITLTRGKMSITPEERQSIIDEAVNKAVEKALLALPDTMANLFADHKALIDSRDDFYKKYPEFAKHREAVQSVMAEVDGKNPFLSLKEKYDMAVPEIRHRIKTMSGLDMTSVSSHPNRHIESISKPAMPGKNGLI